MKGIVFSEFIEMVEDKFSPDMADDIIDGCELASGGAYTAVGTYDYRELISLVVELSKRSGIKVPDLVSTFGRHLLGRFTTLYPVFFENTSSTFDVLRRLDDWIHVEVHKLYPDVELPRFYTVVEDGDLMVMDYCSPRCLSPFAVGLIQGCGDHYGESLSIDTENLESDGSRVRFTILRVG